MKKLGCLIRMAPIIVERKRYYRVMDLSARLCGALVVLAVVAAPVLVPAVASADAVTRPCPGPNQYYADPDEGTKFWECSNGIAYRFECPASLVWDIKLLTCNYPDQVARETTTVAGPAKLKLLPVPHVSGLNAKVTDATGAPLPWAKVVFTAAGVGTLCTAIANSHGVAECDSPNLLGGVISLLTGYTATYAGNSGSGIGNFDASSSHGAITP